MQGARADLAPGRSARPRPGGEETQPGPRESGAKERWGGEWLESRAVSCLPSPTPTTSSRNAPFQAVWWLLCAQSPGGGLRLSWGWLTGSGPAGRPGQRKGPGDGCGLMSSAQCWGQWWGLAALRVSDPTALPLRQLTQPSVEPSPITTRPSLCAPRTLPGNGPRLQGLAEW